VSYSIDEIDDYTMPIEVRLAELGVLRASTLLAPLLKSVPPELLLVALGFVDAVRVLKEAEEEAGRP
jgi:hypothetical protein